MPGSSGAPWNLAYPTLGDAPDGPDLAKDIVDELTLPASGVLGSAWVCTSSTRPPALVGRCIFETDTGKLLHYYDPPGAAAAGWYPPWNVPWGWTGRTVRATTAGPVAYTAPPVSIVTSNVLVTAGRRYRVDLTGLVYNDTDGGEVSLAAHINGTQVVSNLITEPTANRWQRSSSYGEYAPTTTASVALDIYLGAASAGSGYAAVSGVNVPTVTLNDVGPQ